MTRRAVLIAAAAIVISAVAITIGWQLGQRRRAPEEVVEVQVPEMPVVEGPAVTIELFFPGQGGLLYTEERQIPVEGDLVAHLERVLEALVAGPESPELFPALPPEITVGWIHLNPQGILYVDLEYAGESPLPSWGSRREMLTVYSVVNSVLANAADLAAVVLLRNGQQHPTFAGHLDTSRPLLANRDLVAVR